MLRLATNAMATRFELVLAPGSCDAGSEGEARLRAAGEAALAAIERADAEWSAFASSSFLGHLNRTAALRAVALDEDQFELFAICDEVARASDGAFDPSVAPLLRALDGRGVLDPTRAAERVGWRHVLLDREARTVRFARAGVALDFGGIAKGHALELAKRELRDAGVHAALLHGGTSSVVAFGAPPGAHAWRVELEGGAHAPVVELRDAALSVSAQHGRTLADGSGHVLDPRGNAAAASDATVAVVHADARHAEAWSTALLVLDARSRASADGAVDAGANRAREPGAHGARQLEVAIGRGPRFARAWQFTRPSGSSFLRSATVPT
ncbi:MAG: FAD:protein FMN transferase [Planctomycetes bacterium]|nr:FAD:protein FMN transferase [Planctomycetota bacterium]